MHWVAERYQRLPVRAEWVDYEPYPDMISMRTDMEYTGILKITTCYNAPGAVVLDPEVNLMFRAVHDFDHCQFGLNFGFAGEQQAGRILLNRCRDLMGRQFLFCEIVAQAAVATGTGVFAEQKFVLFEEWVIDRVVGA